ncbi:hypothetical protein K7432_016253 [Basidiobolus ranarum]|uniref:Transcription initiation factor IIE subunit alpha N-terminal domain-containing protein n=1 Tax=Basidiobolus ranarum TaxID=34480 RepID=A0ABR2VN27_9FUNG
MTKKESRRPEQRAVDKTYYYIDYKQLVDVVKWKMYKMRELVRTKMRSELDNKGYVCPMCGKTYSALEVQSLMDMTTFLFHCEICSNELRENDNADNVKTSEEFHSRLMEQSKPIIELLKLTDDLVMPAFSLEGLGDDSNDANSKNGDTGARSSAFDRELSYAQDTGMAAGEVRIIFEDDKKDSSRARELELEKKRQQNALPAWYMKSTITGELAKPQSANPALESSLEAAEQMEQFDPDEILEREDYYAEYYAHLQKLMVN